MRTIPMPPLRRFGAAPATAGRALGHDGVTWAIYELDGTGPKVRDLNSYEACFVNSVQDHMAAKAVKDLAQIRRDLVAAREATARVMREWRESLGVEAPASDDLAAATRAIVNRAAEHAHYGRELGGRAEYFAQPGLALWDAEGYGRAWGLSLAASIVGAREYAMPPKPPVWGRERETLRGLYQLWRSERRSVLASALLAVFGTWEEPCLNAK